MYTLVYTDQYWYCNLICKSWRSFACVKHSCNDCILNKPTLYMYSLLICNWAYVTCTSGSTGFNIHLALPGKIAFLSKRQLSNQCKPEHFPVKYAQIFQHNLPPKISTNFLRNRLFFCEFDSEKPGKFDFFFRNL